jgi:hypothetical protein
MGTLAIEDGVERFKEEYKESEDRLVKGTAR